MTEERNGLTDLFAACWKDDALKARFIADPKAVLAERGIPRSGYVVRTADGGEGTVTSGNLSPMLDTGVGLAYVSPPTSHGTGAQVEIRGRWVPGVVKEPPFHKDGG